MNRAPIDNLIVLQISIGGRSVNKMALSSRDKETGAGGVPGSRGDMRYQAFLSYSHQDSEQAGWLHKAIERFAVPRALVGRTTAYGSVPRSLTPIFRDRHELAASSDLGQTIRAALKQSRFLIVLCSPAAAASRWVNEEIATFKKLHGDRRVLAAIVGGEPWASEIDGREAEECFPPALREKFDRRGRATGKRAEPIAADLRETGDGREAGKLKLVAGMLGLGLDELVRREQQRRSRRLTYIAAASIAGMAMTSGLALFAFDKRDEARDQRREAEGLVGFMLGDLRDELEPIGRLAALDAVGSRALAYFEGQDKAELSDAALAQRSQALNLLGQISNARADPDGALSRYHEARRSTAELVERSPNDPQRLFDHAQNIFFIGEIARKRGNGRQAEAAYREYKRLADRMVAADPDNPKWRMEKLYANENLGIALFNRRQFAEAARQFEESLRPMGSQASIDTGNADFQKELSTLLAWQADAHSALGHIDRAIAVRERQVAFLHRLIAGGQSDVMLRQELIPAHQGLGILLTSNGQVERGIGQLRQSVAESERLLPVEPDNAYWAGLAAQARLELARTLLRAKRVTNAAAEARIGCEQAERVLARDPGTAWRSLATACSSVRARLALAGGDRASALRLAAQALGSARAERSADPVKDRYRIAAAHRLVGDVQQQMGNAQGARAAWANGLAQLPRTTTERPSEMNERAELLRLLGRDDEAGPMFERLAAMGHRPPS
jgi:tetratricopeptide (TPR) repeat protein